MAFKIAGIGELLWDNLPSGKQLGGAPTNFAYHMQQEKDADVVVSCIPMPIETSTSFGVIEVDEDFRVTGFQEKPKKPKSIPGQPDKILASMGIYLFKRDSLCEELELDAKSALSQHDFGKNVIPHMIKAGKKVYAYNFVDNSGESAYWRDIGTRDAYYEANMDLVKPNSEFNVHDRKWPIRTNHIQYPPVKTITYIKENGETENGAIINSLISGGCVLEGAHIEGSIISPNVYVGRNVNIKYSVIMNNVSIGAGAKIQNTIIDKEVVIPEGAEIGYDLAKDRKYFDVTSSGIVIVGKKETVK